MGAAWEVRTVTIAEGAALSAALDVRGVSGIWLVMPAEWTAAVLGFKVSPVVGGTFAPLYDAAGDRVGVALQVDYIQIAPPALVGAGLVKLWSRDAGGLDVEQDAERAFVVILRS